MKNVVLCGAFALLLPASLFLGHAAPNAQEKKAAPASEAESFEIDPVHSSVVFRVQHLETSWFYGRFNHVQGSLLYDAAKPEVSSISVEIPADSIDTNSDKRDQHLKGPDFFNAKEFPTISFNSTAVKKTKDGLEVEGDLTLHGETQSVTARTIHMGRSESAQLGKLAGFTAAFDFKRSDFGMEYGLPDQLGDDVHVEIGIEAKRRE